MSSPTYTQQTSRFFHCSKLVCFYKTTKHRHGTRRRPRFWGLFVNSLALHGVFPPIGSKSQDLLVWMMATMVLTMFYLCLHICVYIYMCVCVIHGLSMFYLCFSFIYVLILSMFYLCVIYVLVCVHIVLITYIPISFDYYVLLCCTQISISFHLFYHHTFVTQLTRKNQGLFVVAAQVVASHWHQIRRLVLTNDNFFEAQSENLTCENPGYVETQQNSLWNFQNDVATSNLIIQLCHDYCIANGSNLSLSVSLISALSISKTVALPCLETTTASAYFSCSKAGRWKHIGHIQLHTSRLHQQEMFEWGYRRCMTRNETVG